RREFVRQLRAMFRAKGPAAHFMCMIDVSQLRVINNLCGMEAGDQLLKEMCVILQVRVPGTRLVGRLGDSSFGVLLGGDSQEWTREQAEKLLREIANHHFRWGDHGFTVAANLGLAMLTGDGADAEALLRNADAACMAAKQKGPNRMQIYSVDDASLEAQKHMLDWAGRIDGLMAENRLFVRCQMIAPIFPERDPHSHYEILLGVRDEQGEVVPPFGFVVAAERWNRISEIDRWQIQSVFRWIREHRSSFDSIGGFSINLSGQSLNSEGFLEFLHTQLAPGDLPAEKIAFEITETSAIGEFGHAGQFIRQIKHHGCRFSLDDFGSGFSSYAYLKNLQADYLKIDGSFIRDLASSETDYALVKSMNEIGHSLGMKTIAEYVESEAIMEKLREIGVDYAQGYAIRKPSTITELVLSGVDS
ncbi:MAG: hypothetical protein H6R26_1556, partial [Proteobacteria bacterium]|nr:hypothetical protein [Pseudomonadota bacterium]